MSQPRDLLWETWKNRDLFRNQEWCAVVGTGVCMLHKVHSNQKHCQSVNLTRAAVTAHPCHELVQRFILSLKKGKVFYGQEPPSGESTTTECLINYQLLGVSNPMGNS